MKAKVLFWFLLALLWVLPAAAQDMPAPDAARVRFVHLSADVANVDVYVGDEPAAADIAFGTISDYTAFTPGIYPFSVVETGSADALITPADVELLANHDYVYGIMGLAEEGTFQRLLIDETAQFDDTRAGLAHVLFLHAISGVAPVDARIEGSDQRFASGLEFGGYEFHSVAAGEYPLVVSLSSDTSAILLDQLNPVTLYPDRLYFIAALNTADGGIDMLVSVTGTLTISQLLANGDDFNTLRAFIEAAGLMETLSNRSAPPVTVFAPTDEAFTAAFDALGLEPGTLLDAPDLLNSILLYHISPQLIISADANQIDTMPTLQGGTIQLTLEGTTMLLNGGARVTQADILAANGVIHLIDGLLIPPAP
ncbi:MAG: fasciclin domain-containing protein [Anaerolineae bacterium]